MERALRIARELDPHIAGARVADDVGQRLLDDPVERRLYVRRRPPLEAGVHLDDDAAAARDAFGENL